MDWYEIGEVLGDVLAGLPPKERERVSFSIPEDLPLVRMDFRQLVRVIHNLVENALKYGGTDSLIRVGASTTASEIRIWVDDEGSGVPPAERHKVFDKFYRGKTTVGNSSGTGLGLAISAEIVRYHGGRIWVEDAKPHGARFAISLPRLMNEKAES
jgi:K+-sensing histidine kinase KdpD